MTNPESFPAPGNEASKGLAAKETEQIEFDSITPQEELRRLKTIYSNEDGKQRLLKDLKSNEFAILAHRDNIDSPTFQRLNGTYNTLVGIYEQVFNEPYKTQLDVETGEKDYADELHDKLHG